MRPSPPHTCAHTHTCTPQFQAFTELPCLCKTTQRQQQVFSINLCFVAKYDKKSLLTHLADNWIYVWHWYTKIFSSRNSLTKLPSSLNRALWYLKTFTTVFKMLALNGTYRKSKVRTFFFFKCYKF
jgi:hypothetical protein